MLPARLSTDTGIPIKKAAEVLIFNVTAALGTTNSFTLPIRDAVHSLCNPASNIIVHSRHAGMHVILLFCQERCILMKWLIMIFFSSSLLYNMPSFAVDTDAVLGGVIGGGIGAAIGSEAGGTKGAIAGSAIGAAIGVAIATDDDKHDSRRDDKHGSRQKVTYVEHHHIHGPPGHAYGHRIPPGHAKHRKHYKHRY